MHTPTRTLEPASAGRLGVRRGVFAALAMGVLAGSISSAVAIPVGSAALPNLVPLPPFSVHVGAADGYEAAGAGAPLALRFSIATRNLGIESLELDSAPDAGEVAGSATRKPARQCISWADRACVGWLPAGDLTWHEQHQHWHFDDYAVYELRRLDAEHRPDLSEAGLIAPGQKASFCLQDTNSPDSDPRSGEEMDTATYYAELVRSRSGFYAGCNASRQGISPGWADTYGWGLWGQQIPLAGVAAGEYALVVTVDPRARIAESSDADNIAYSIVDVPSAGGATDTGSPRSTITTPDGAIIAPAGLSDVAAPPPLAIRERVEGSAFDEGSGIAGVIVTWRDPRGTTSAYPVTLVCGEARASCTWSATNLVPGFYVVSVYATDEAGNVESPLPASITVVNL